MGYQALLFCPDEKLARVISQLFAELDFTIEHVQEPFATVKRLMAQHYDAVAIDCENEPNATLLFKSARTSSANQSSLAIAVVEGQDGVAKAYRIGANLVLTKPINVEQAKGTLRVARGLLRKTADTATVTHVNPLAAPAETPATIAPHAITPANAVSRSIEPAATPATQGALPEFEIPLPTMAASTNVYVEGGPAAEPAREVQARPSVTVQPSAEDQPRTVPEPAKPPAAPVASKANENPAASLTTAQGAAAAPAPAREAAAEKKTVEFEAAYQKDSTQTIGSASTLDGPSFAALDDERAGGTGGGKKILVGAAVILALAALGYLGWSKLSTPKTSVTPPPVSEPQPRPQPATPPTASPLSGPAATPATGATNQAGADTLAGTSKTVVASAAAPAAAAGPVLRIDASPEPATKKPGPAPIVVKATPGKKTPMRTEEAAAQLPSPLAVAATNASGMSNLTVPSTHSQPSLITVNISQGVSQGLLIKRVQPKYPANALAMHLQGAVQLQATINKEGNIVNLTLLNGDPTLARAAMDAVRQWRYKPYYLDRVPVDIETQITVNFKLPN